MRKYLQNQKNSKYKGMLNMNGNATQTVLNQLYILKQKCATSYTVLQFCHEYIQVT